MLTQNTEILSRRQAFGGNPEEKSWHVSARRRFRERWRAWHRAISIGFLRITSLFVAESFSMGHPNDVTNSWQIPYIHQHSRHQEPNIMRFQNKLKRLSTFGWLFTTDSASLKNTANSTSYHPAFLAWLFISSETMIQTSWLCLFVSLKHAIVQGKITNKKFQPITGIFWHIKIAHDQR